MKIFTEHPHWTKVLEICTQLSKSGYRAYLAGGCVRDAQLGVTPQDFDVATDATPDEVQKLFPHSLDVGKSFGVIIIPFEDFQIEVASFRQDGSYKDGRRPDSIEFSSPEEDAKRRDFTVNALFYDWVDDKVIDYVDGLKDLEARVIRSVGTPEKRFKEDHLRLIRAVRFHAQLDFEIERQTFKAIEKLAELVGDVSKERIRDELLKLLKTKNRSSGVKLLKETELLSYAIPRLKEFSVSPDFFRTLETLTQPFQLTQEVNLWAAFLLHFDHSGKKAKTLLKELKCSNYVVSHVTQLIQAYWTSLNRQAKPAVLMKLIAQFGHDLLELHRIQANIDSAMSRWSEISQMNMQLPDPWITSGDLKEVGVQEGPEFGQILDEMFDLQLNAEIGSREEALEMLKHKLKKPESAR